MYLALASPQSAPTRPLMAIACSTSAEPRARADEPAQHRNREARADAPVDLDRQPLARPFVRDRQALQLLAVSAAVEHEVIGPALVRAGRRLRPGWAAAGAGASAEPASARRATAGTPAPRSWRGRRARERPGCAA